MIFTPPPLLVPTINNNKTNDCSKALLPIEMLSPPPPSTVEMLEYKCRLFLKVQLSLTNLMLTVQI